MFDTLESVRKDLGDLVSRLEPEVLPPDVARDAVEKFAEIERLASAGKALAARRVAASGSWKAEGDRSPAHWMARTTKTSVGHAVAVLETAERLAELPGTDAAVRAGRLSPEQAREVASAAAADPKAEAKLLNAARTESVSGLRDECARVRAAALPDEATRYERIRSRRRFRHWSDPDGAFRMDAVLTPDAGAVLLAAIEPHRERIFREARKQGRRESYEAYAADALVAIAAHARDCENEPVASGPKACVNVRVDHRVLQNGHVSEGDTCEIEGVGPVPAAVAIDFANDAIINALVTDGTDVTKISHLGRKISARLRTAVIERDKKCVVPGCDVHRGLEIDHLNPVHRLGRAELINLARLCAWHHYLKTHKGWTLSGCPGRWSFTPPHRSTASPGP
ncbi:MAG TPA: DUF222 domain-containing protein [Actinomycetota bacterium]|nr:DUF222 domain-containing protein [Actinomycetota bacterium]